MNVNSPQTNASPSSSPQPWPELWQRWRSEGPSWLQRQARRIYRRWVYACAAFFAVLLVFGLWQIESLEELWHVQSVLSESRAQVAAQPRDLVLASSSARGDATQALTQSLAHLPGSSSRSLLWPALQQSFERHRLVLLSLQPVSDAVAAPLPSQAVALRLRGRFDDWGRAWTALSEGIPVWTMERVHITPQAHAPWVEIDVLLRVWLRADQDGERHGAGKACPTQCPHRNRPCFFMALRRVRGPPSRLCLRGSTVPWQRHKLRRKIRLTPCTGPSQVCACWVFGMDPRLPTRYWLWGRIGSAPRSVNA